ncbi:hypothetical protein B296_00040967, partial [Ensete ventricosum]
QRQSHAELNKVLLWCIKKLARAFAPMNMDDGFNFQDPSSRVRRVRPSNAKKFFPKPFRD